MTSPRRLAAAVLTASTCVLAAACASTGEPAQTAATDVRTVTEDGLTQTVVPATDGLTQVTVTTATFGELDGVDGVLQLTVAGAGEERVTAASGADLADNAPVTLAFDPLGASAGETVELTFRYAGAEPLALYVDPYDAYAHGELRPGGGDLAFTLGHADRVGGALEALGRTASETADAATSDVAFLVVWLLALAGAGALVVRSRRAHGRP